MPGWPATKMFRARSVVRCSNPRTTSSGRCGLAPSTPNELSAGFPDPVAQKQVVAMQPSAEQLAPGALVGEQLDPLDHPETLLLSPPRQHRRQGEEHLVEEPLPNELPRHVRASLAQQNIEMPLSELLHRAAEVEGLALPQHHELARRRQPGADLLGTRAGGHDDRAARQSWMPEI